MRPFTVILDLDSTVYDLLTPWLEWHNAKTGERLTPADIKTWDWGGPDMGDFLQLEGMFHGLKPYAGAIEAIKHVSTCGVKQIFCSTVTYKIPARFGCEKYSAIERDFPFLGMKSLVLVGGDKSNVKGDLLVDDGPHNLVEFRKSGGLTVAATVSNTPFCVTDVAADWIMTDWKQYPWIVEQARTWKGIRSDR